MIRGKFISINVFNLLNQFLLNEHMSKVILCNYEFNKHIDFNKKMALNIQFWDSWQNKLK